MVLRVAGCTHLDPHHTISSTSRSSGKKGRRGDVCILSETDKRLPSTSLQVPRVRLVQERGQSLFPICPVPLVTGLTILQFPSIDFVGDLRHGSGGVLHESIVEGCRVGLSSHGYIRDEPCTKDKRSNTGTAVFVGIRAESIVYVVREV